MGIYIWATPTLRGHPLYSRVSVCMPKHPKQHRRPEVPGFSWSPHRSSSQHKGLILIHLPPSAWHVHRLPVHSLGISSLEVMPLLCTICTHASGKKNQRAPAQHTNKTTSDQAKTGSRLRCALRGSREDPSVWEPCQNSCSRAIT